MTPPLNTLLRAGFRQGEALGYLITLIGRAKKGLHVLRYSVFTENIGLVKSKKRYTRPQMFSFPLKVSVKRKKKSSLFMMRSPIFLRGPRFQPAYPVCKSCPMLTIHI